MNDVDLKLSRRLAAAVGPEGSSNQATIAASTSAPFAEAQRASLALHNLRGVAIALVVLLHSSLAYLASVDSPGPAYAFDKPPYGWLAYPVLDPSRCLGFDIACAWLDLFLMSLMFFLSGVFVWPSLGRAGPKKFLTRRLLRFGAALLLAIFVVMPVALYPAYRLATANPDLAGYLAVYRALPFIPIGPMWFLWVLLALDAVAAGLHRWGGGTVEAAGASAETVANHPIVALTAFALLAAAAYVPLALAFTPWRWGALGPFGVQLSRQLLYAAYFFLGLVVGRRGLGLGLLRTDVVLSRRWRALFGLAAAGFVVWMLLAWVTLRLADKAPLALTLVADVSYAAAGWLSLLLVLAVALRFGAARRPFVGAVADKALPIYVLHYPPIVWMQFGLLGVALPAVVKGALVFATALAITWGFAAGAERAARAGSKQGSKRTHPKSSVTSQSDGSRAS